MGDIKLTYGLDEKSDGKRIVFTCENSIPHPENMDITQVFDRFYKADKSRNEKSTGLGLAIAKEMVEKMGGTIEARLNGRKFIIEIGFDVI